MKLWSFSIQFTSLQDNLFDFVDCHCFTFSLLILLHIIFVVIWRNIWFIFRYKTIENIKYKLKYKSALWLFIVYCWLFTWSYGNWWILSLNLGVFLLSLFFRTINTTSSRIRGRERDISNSKISSAVKTMY